MKNLLLTLFFVCVTTLTFCQTPAPQNSSVYLKYYAPGNVLHNSVVANKRDSNEPAISSNALPARIATGYSRSEDYSIVFSIGQNSWYKTAPVVQPWQYLNGSISGLGFRGGYTTLITAKGNISLLNEHLPLEK